MADIEARRSYQAGQMKEALSTSQRLSETAVKLESQIDERIEEVCNMDALQHIVAVATEIVEHAKRIKQLASTIEYAEVVIKALEKQGEAAELAKS